MQGGEYQQARGLGDVSRLANLAWWVESLQGVTGVTATTSDRSRQKSSGRRSRMGVGYG